MIPRNGSKSGEGVFSPVAQAGFPAHQGAIYNTPGPFAKLSYHKNQGVRGKLGVEALRGMLRVPR